MRRLAVVLIACLIVPLEIHAQDVDLSYERTSGILIVDNTPHPYLAEGTGIPCIVAGQAHLYPPLFSDSLKQHIQFVFVDFKNTWSATPDKPVEHVTMQDLVDEIEQVRQELGHDQVCVFGHSALGLLALEYALDYPEHTSHVVAIGTPPFMGDRFWEAVSEFWKADASERRKEVLKQNQKKIPDETISTLSPHDAAAMDYVRSGPRYWHDPTYDSYWIWIGKHFSARMVEHLFAELLTDYDETDQFSNIKTPVFLAHGRHDYAVPYHLWREHAKKLPEGTFHLFKRSGHFPMVEEEELFERRLIAWLRGL